MNNQNKQAEYICSRCGSKGWVIITKGDDDE